MNRIQATQEESRESHQQARQPWQAREKGLVGAMDKVGKAVSEASAFADLMASGDISVPPTESVSLKDLEAETHVWELPTLLAEATRYQREPASGVLVEGWLYKKSSMRMALQQWNRRWFMMDKDGIYYFRTSAEMKKMGNEYLQTLERVKICDLVLCTVREIPGDPRFTFEIITPNQKPILLQARGPLEYKMWVDGIRSSIEMQLVSGEVDAGQLMKGIGKQRKFKRGSGDGATKTFASMLESEKVPSKSTSNISSSDDEIADDEEDKEWTDISAESDFRKSISKPRNPLIPDILESNPVCADCGQLNPDWVCMNLGVLVCIECSGVHRSLGVHVSKVRSLKLDSLSDSEGRLLLVMGNDRVNPIWEAGIGSQQGWSKPKGDSGRQAKENWIKSKYLWKGFLHDRFKDKSSDDKRMHYNKKLFEAARMADVLGVAEALAYGAEIEWQNLEEDGRTPLHICSLNRPSLSDPSSWTGIECAELLLQNGAKLDTMDNNTQGVLDCAVIGGGEREMVEFLSRKLQEKQNPGGRSS
jgi:Arf-GAP/coiled-coil/ANK repeat/PH domain-containing protein